MKKEIREQREEGAKAGYRLSQNFGTLASGVLMGLTEGLSKSGSAKHATGKKPGTSPRGRGKKLPGPVLKKLPRPVLKKLPKPALKTTKVGAGIEKTNCTQVVISTKSCHPYQDPEADCANRSQLRPSLQSSRL